MMFEEWAKENSDSGASPSDAGLAACPKCGREWPRTCEQTICIDLHSECICCKFVRQGKHNQHGTGDGTDEELDAISTANTAQSALKWQIIVPKL